MRVYTGGIVTETNTFSSIPTGLADFDVVRAADIADGSAIQGFGSLFDLLREEAGARGWEYSFGLFAFAQPAGLTVRSAYESLRYELLAGLEQAQPVDIVLLFLHGAMVAEGYDDCELDIVSRVRQIVGPDTVIGVELDLHSSITQSMLDRADVIVLFKEYPHTDIGDRALDLFRIAAAAAENRIRPAMALYDCRMIGLYVTTTEPMRSFVGDMLALEGTEGVLSVSLAHCFPWGDRPPCSTQVLVLTDNDPIKAERLAQQLGQRFYAMRHRLDHDSLSLDDALDAATAVESGPVVIADQSDNAGGGAPSDSTFALKALLERRIGSAALGMIWDPVAVQLAGAAGEGATLDLRLGGKTGPMSGDPLDLRVTVTRMVRDLIQEWPQQNGRAIAVPCGDAVALHCEGIDIVVNSKRTQVLSTQVFSRLGIDPAERRFVVVKSTQHFHAAFAPIASQVIYMAAPGAVAPRFTEIPYQRIDTHVYPWVEDPFAAGIT
jgi:microcystin degradation protein MlrC